MSYDSVFKVILDSSRNQPSDIKKFDYFNESDIPVSESAMLDTRMPLHIFNACNATAESYREEYFKTYVRFAG